MAQAWSAGGGHVWRAGLVVLALLLGIATPALAEIVIQARDGRTFTVPVPGSDVRSIRFTDGPGSSSAPSPAEVDIAGTWRHGAGGETWTFTPIGGHRYEAVEQGLANASGVATVTGHRFRIDFTWQDGRHHGYYEMTVDPGGRRATGRAWDSRPAEGAATMTRQPSAPEAAAPRSPSLAGTWRHGAGGETWTFTPLGGNRYRAAEKGFANAAGYATLVGDRFRIDFTWANGQHRGYYQMTLAPDGQKASGRAWDSRPAEGPATMTRVPGP